ncbi:hypothetical protein M3Y98_01049400 [Aphelenchoides besseyi]|nr:hypothetical protein M3Y98_01049400 [Aphelenchoides besseyi]
MEIAETKNKPCLNPLTRSIFFAHYVKRWNFQGNPASTTRALLISKSFVYTAREYLKAGSLHMQLEDANSSDENDWSFYPTRCRPFGYYGNESGKAILSLLIPEPNFNPFRRLNINKYGEKKSEIDLDIAKKILNTPELSISTPVNHNHKELKKMLFKMSPTLTYLECPFNLLSSLSKIQPMQLTEYRHVQPEFGNRFQKIDLDVLLRHKISRLHLDLGSPSLGNHAQQSAITFSDKCPIQPSVKDLIIEGDFMFNYKRHLTSYVLKFLPNLERLYYFSAIDFLNVNNPQKTLKDYLEKLHCVGKRALKFNEHLKQIVFDIRLHVYPFVYYHEDEYDISGIDCVLENHFFDSKKLDLLSSPIDDPSLKICPCNQQSDSIIAYEDGKIRFLIHAEYQESLDQSESEDLDEYDSDDELIFQDIIG